VHAHNPRRGSAAPNVNGSVAAAIAATEVSAGALCEVRSLGVTSYADGLALQHQLVQQRTRNTIPDQLVLLQHTHVVTQGRNTQAGNVLLGEAALRAKGIELYETDRGGDVTYHGPGQLVAYPILDLRPDRCDLHRYVRDLERVLQATLADFGVDGHTVPGRTGVWVDRPDRTAAKIAAIGVRVSRWVTSHGIALNVTTDLDFFQCIVPCGLHQTAVTSLREMLPETPTLQQVGTRFADHFGVIFERRMQTRVGRD
jgi:lipoyl(octanoyl) transferase